MLSWSLGCLSGKGLLREEGVFPVSLRLPPAPADEVGCEVAQCPPWLETGQPRDCGEPAGRVKVRATEGRLTAPRAHIPPASRKAFIRLGEGSIISQSCLTRT